MLGVEAGSVLQSCTVGCGVCTGVLLTASCVGHAQVLAQQCHVVGDCAGRCGFSRESTIDGTALARTFVLAKQQMYVVY